MSAGWHYFPIRLYGESAEGLPWGAGIIRTFTGWLTYECEFGVSDGHHPGYSDVDDIVDGLVRTNPDRLDWAAIGHTHRSLTQCRRIRNYSIFCQSGYLIRPWAIVFSLTTRSKSMDFNAVFGATKLTGSLCLKWVKTPYSKPTWWWMLTSMHWIVAMPLQSLRPYIFLITD